jgi:hypothetical protein
MAWIFYASGSIVLFTILFLLQRIIAVDSRHQRAMAVIFNFIAGVFAVIIFLVTGAFRHFHFLKDIVLKSPKFLMLLYILLLETSVF